MQGKFSNFTTKNIEDLVKQNQQNINQFKQNNQQMVNNLEGMMQRYAGMNQQELFGEFYKLAQQKRQDGTLTDEYINNLKTTIFPFLTPEQQQTFHQLFQSLR